MVERLVKIELTTGLQSRPAAQFVQKANQYTAHIFLEKDGKRVNAKSIMGLMSLAVGTGETVKILTEGSDEEIALEELALLISKPN